MKYRLILILSLLAASVHFGWSQNRHFTYFQLAPLDINPALAGEFQGSIRVGGLLREQAFGVASSTLMTTNFHADFNLLNGFTKGDWISFGISLDALESGGAAKFSRTYYKPGVAYHFAYGKKSNSVLTLGVQYGGMQQGAEFNDVVTGVSIVDGFDQAIEDIKNDLNGENGTSSSASDLLIGLTWKTKFAKTNKFITGLSVGNILSPGGSVLSGAGSGGGTGGGGFANRDSELDILIRGFAELRVLMNKRMAFSPAVLYNKQGQASNIEANAMIDYMVKPELGLIIRGGLGARLADAADAQFLLGADYKGFKMGMSFDLGISGVQGVDNAFEIGLGYIHFIHKKPKVKPIIICPRL